MVWNAQLKESENCIMSVVICIGGELTVTFSLHTFAVPQQSPADLDVSGDANVNYQVRSFT